MSEKQAFIAAVTDKVFCFFLQKITTFFLFFSIEPHQPAPRAIKVEPLTQAKRYPAVSPKG
jgi:hypothetical protein